MSKVLVVGGGLAGCTAALELARCGREVVILEITGEIGGKVRQFGCKATDGCNNCGLCLVGDLWNQVEKNEKIEILTFSQVLDILGTKGDFRAVILGRSGTFEIDGIDSIIASIGFECFSAVSSGSLEFENRDGIITGSELENIISRRNLNKVFEEAPASIAFIQCYGSRDTMEKAMYCSRVCCGYSTRSARVLRKYYPDARIVIFHMDLQEVEKGNYFDLLASEGIELVRCRPVKIKGVSRKTVVYEKPGNPGLVEEEFDVTVLSEGIHPPKDAGKLAEICMLGRGGNGFLKYVSSGKDTGVYITGCASGPKRIDEVYADALTVAREICGGRA